MAACQGDGRVSRLHENMALLLAGARDKGIQVVFVPHRRTRPGDYENWKFHNPSHARISEHKVFEQGSWGAEFHPDFQPTAGDLIASEHWTSSGFANTDLDFMLKQHRVDHIILAGLRANTCIEATGRYGVELGYHVTLAKDAVAAYSFDEMKAAIEVNFPAFAHAVLSSAEIVDRY